MRSCQPECSTGAGYITPRPSTFSLPDADEPIDDLIDRSCERYERRQKRRDAEAWVPINVPDEPGKPFAVLLMGDTHIDDDDCAWPLLRKHVHMVRDTPGVYAAFVGDIANSWIGRLSRLYANQQTTKHDSLRLAEWYFSTLGHRLLVATLGNHDNWSDAPILQLLNQHGSGAYFPNWEARVTLKLGDAEWRMHMAHSFRGTSIYNSTHGPSRAAMFSGGAAELYVAGHTHQFGYQSFTIAETGAFVHTVRTRGYKGWDEHALVNGFPQGEAGHSVLAIFKPNATTPAGRITIFADVEAGVEVLKAMRTACTHPTKRAHKTEKRVHVERRSPEGQRKASGVRDRKRPGRSGRKGAVRSAPAKRAVPGRKAVRGRK